MRKILLSSVVVSALSLNLFGDDIADLKAEVKALTTKVKKLEKKQKRTSKTLSKVKKHDAFDNVKFGLDFRNAVDVIEYKNNKTGETASNNSLLTSRLYLTMASSPIKDLIFQGKLAVYSTWGSHLYVDDNALKDWAASSRPADTVMRIKEAYFIYNTALGEQPISVSVGRRPATNGFLANYRENEKVAGSPLAHITNMEVNAAMAMFNLSRFVDGAYTKLVYGRAHSGEMQSVYGDSPVTRMPYALSGGDVNATLEDESVDFFVFLGDGYNDGQYQLAYQWAHIFDTKGKALNGAGVADDVNKAASGSADLGALSLKVEGVGDEISDFLDETTLFLSLAATKYNPKENHELLGSRESKTGYSYWIGAVFPDSITDAGKFGLEYNHGTKYWTPMTWAEDTAIGSKIAVRGDAYEAYWNFDLFGVKYLPSQIRYTYVQHNFTPNINCAGWVIPEEVDITSSDLRFAVSYRY
ncbi:DUF3373 family protein [Sulfurimonas marina]|uniref:DUF3373 domain-containing protein n=1 Tax=Sulfurimonas marina TaxID=2590551 RepID=A0A7M1AU98_9BACT|nr:DUF3373 family protein [Sulfurimonas marina]QOP40980.1 DUF3373 domain-containing protein [Sulfurimonas marina]